MRACVLDDGGLVTCWAGGVAPRIVSGVSYAIDVGVGSTHACALRVSGEVLCWGGNRSGELGQGDVGLPRDEPQPVIGL